jgi:hypothetical protein
VPSITTPVSPSAQETVTGWPSWSWRVPSSVPITQGMPSSRLTIAAWQVRPPRSVTMAAAVLRIGSQSGSVMPVTSTEPGRKRWISSTLFSTATGPAPMRRPTARPVISTRPRSFSAQLSMTEASRPAWAVSGRAWTM